MTTSQLAGADGLQHSPYWMRAVSFAGLHRVLKAVADYPNGLRAAEINKLVRENDIPLTRRSTPPAPTTLYHYRNTLLRLNALKRDGQMLHVNDDDPDVCTLLRQPAPANGSRSLSNAARDPFAALVLKNEQCRSLFFDLFMPPEVRLESVSSFRRNAVSVRWARHLSINGKEIVFQNNATGCTARCASPASVAAILYGVRYWARDELGLIDEYCQQAGEGTIMFPLSCPEPFTVGIDSPIIQTVRFLLSLRTPGEWTLFSILDLITRCCEARRHPIHVLSGAIDWLRQEWPHHTMLIPTSRALATLTAVSTQRENLELRSYYKAPSGPYVSHIRIHKDVTADPMEVTDHHVRCASKTKT